MDSWIVVTVLVLSVVAGAVAGWVLLGQDGGRRPRHQSADRPVIARQGRHRGRFKPRHAPTGSPDHVKSRRTHAKDDR